MDLANGGDLYTRLSKKGAYSEATAVKLARQLASALRHIHRRGVVHRDLKPENILLSSERGGPNAKVNSEFAASEPFAAMLSKSRCVVVSRTFSQIVDFGLARHLVNQTHMTAMCGTWSYSAPEVRFARKPYNHKVDIWSLGVIYFAM